MVGYVMEPGKTSMIVMKDLAREGYKQVDYKHCIDLEHCKLAMEEFAAFHTIGYLLKNGKSPADLQADFPYLFIENIDSEVLVRSFEKNFKWSTECLIQLVEASDLEADVIQHAGGLKSLLVNFVDTVSPYLAPVEPFATVCWRDCIHRNMLFKYDENHTKPIRVKFLDFQVIRYSAPTCDLALFLYTGSEDVLQEECLHQLLTLYHTSLQKNMKQFDLNLEFTYQEFYDQFVKTRAHGILKGLLVQPFFLCEAGYLPEAEMNKPDSAIVPKLLCEGLVKSGYAPHILDLDYSVFYG